MAAIGGHFDIVAISNLPWIIVAIVASFAIMAMGVSGGIEKANKVAMPVLFFLFVGLGIYIAFLPGAGCRLKYIFTLDPKGLANPMVWISLSVRRSSPVRRGQRPRHLWWLLSAQE
ncbi:MAG: hypothetical protein ACLS3C_07275 [Oscillospiraceae bacterium]